MQTFSATCPLLLLICALVGCKSPMRAITSSTLFIPKPVMAHVTTEMEKPPKTEPIRSTIVQGQQAPGVPRVALIDVDGLLVNSAVFRSLQAVDNPVALFREKLHVASQDPDVCAFVIRINSPGGGVVASDLMFHELEQLKAKTGRPVVAYIMETGTGGAYLLATAADMIVTHPNAIVGGVGVVFNRYYLSDIMGQQGAYHEPIVSGENITMGSYTEEISEENQAWFETMAEEFHSRFIESVYRRRPAVDPNLKTTVDGRVFPPSLAKERRLIDGIGYLEEAIKQAAELGGAPSCSVVMYHRDGDTPRSIYADDGLNSVPAQMSPLHMPGLERSLLPGFLYLWQVDPAIERLGKP